MASTFEPLLLSQANFLLNPPLFVAYQTTPQGGVANASWTPITLDTIVLDTYAGWNAGAAAYVAQVPGVYWVSGITAWVLNSTGARAVALYKNNNPIRGSGAFTPANSTDTSSVNTDRQVQLAAGDAISLYGWQHSGAPLATYSDSWAACCLNIRWAHQ